MSGTWKDRLAGARMQVDNSFQSRVAESEFSSQEWGLIMTAVEFDIESPEDPASARMVARTDRIEQIMPELQKIRKQMGGNPMAGGDRSGGITGALKKVTDALTGSSDRGNASRQADAEALVEAYAAELQTHLEERGRWSDVCQAAAAERAEDT